MKTRGLISFRPFYYTVKCATSGTFYCVIYIKIQRMVKRNLIGQRIRLARKRAFVSQKDLSARLQLDGLKIDRYAILRIESGRREISDIEIAAIARALGVEVSWLFGQDN
jgi:HTH-type transcriptional regulator, cell division transcriptional repressor